MKILLALTHAGFGGVAKHVIDLAVYFKKRNNEVFIAVGNQKTDLLQELSRYADEVIILPFLKREVSILNDLRTLKTVITLLKKYSFDIIHCHGPKAGFIFRLAGKIVGAKVIYTHHLIVYKQFDPFTGILYRWLEKLASSWGERVITVSNHVRMALIKDKVVKANKILTIYNWISDLDPIYTKEEARNKLNLAKDAFVLSYVGRLEVPKDPLTALEGFHEFLRRATPTSREIKFYIVGDGPLKKDVINVINRLKLGDYVILTGFTKDPEMYLAASDVFILTSRQEGLPIAILEAMKYSLPIISNPVDGVPEQVENGVNGFLVPLGDKYTLCSKILELYSNADLVVKMGQESRKIVQDKFNAEKNLKKIEKVYEDILNNKERG